MNRCKIRKMAITLRGKMRREDRNRERKREIFQLFLFYSAWITKATRWLRMYFSWIE